MIGSQLLIKHRKNLRSTVLSGSISCIILISIYTRGYVMATFSDFAKNIFWVLLLLQIAPLFIKNIKQQYSDLLESKTKVGVISIKGSLYEAGPVVRNLKKFFENDEIKAILLKVECPGGSSGASQTVFNEINYYKSLYPHKYIVAFVENMAASGGYYALCPANSIIAAPSAFIGSIGAYIQHPNFKDFIENYKIKYEVIKTGAYKTAGNPLLDLTPDQKAELQTLTDDVYRQFTRDVASQRPHLPHDTKLWADGRIFTGEQALTLKLIDEVGSPSTIVRVLKENAHIDGKIEWVKPPSKLGFFGSLFSQDSDDDTSSFLSSSVNNICKVIEQRYTTSVECN